MPRLHPVFFFMLVIGGGRENSFNLSDPDCYLLRNDNYFKENYLGASHRTLVQCSWLAMTGSKAVIITGLRR